MTVVVPWAILQASSRPPVEPQISFNWRPITSRTVASGSPAIGPSPLLAHRCRSWPVLDPASAGPPDGGWAGYRDRRGQRRDGASLVDRLGDCLQVGLGLLGRRGRA